MYKIVIAELVLQKDFKAISKSDRERIIKTIHRKLSLEPEKFGKPLLRELRGYYRLRIGHFRIIYRIEKEKITVVVIHVGLRKDMLVYLEAVKRLDI